MRAAPYHVLRRQLLIFLCAGILNTIFTYSIFAALIYIQVYYVWSALISSVFGMLFSFQTIGRWVFRAYRHELINRFIGAFLVTTAVNILCIKWANVFLEDLYLSGIFALFPSSFVSFILNKFFVFRR